MEQTQLVSIIIPVYNGSDYMKEAIDSALNQTYKNIEVIVINDGSDDNGETERTALLYGNRIRYFSKQNGGVSSALNVGIKNMKGEYFSWLSHDDVYAPDKVEKQIYALSESDDKRAVALCRTETIDKNSNITQSKKNVTGKGKVSWEQATMYITKYGANGCALLIPKKVFDSVGYFNEELRYCQDILMWWNIFTDRYSLIFTDDIGVYSRVHARQVTQTRPDLYKKDAEYISGIIPYKFENISSVKNNFLFEYAKNETIRGNKKANKICSELLKKNHLISVFQLFHLNLLKLYSIFRPFIRKLFYMIFRKIKTT